MSIQAPNALLLGRLLATTACVSDSVELGLDEGCFSAGPTDGYWRLIDGAPANVVGVAGTGCEAVFAHRAEEGGIALVQWRGEAAGFVTIDRLPDLELRSGFEGMALGPRGSVALATERRVWWWQDGHRHTPAMPARMEQVFAVEFDGQGALLMTGVARVSASDLEATVHRLAAPDAEWVRVGLPASFLAAGAMTRLDTGAVRLLEVGNARYSLAVLEAGARDVVLVCEPFYGREANLGGLMVIPRTKREVTVVSPETGRAWKATVPEARGWVLDPGQLYNGQLAVIARSGGGLASPNTPPATSELQLYDPDTRSWWTPAGGETRMSPDRFVASLLFFDEWGRAVVEFEGRLLVGRPL